MSTCPCGSKKEYKECCEVFHKGGDAPTAETLMRARYSAFEKNQILDVLRLSRKASFCFVASSF